MKRTIALSGMLLFFCCLRAAAANVYFEPYIPSSITLDKAVADAKWLLEQGGQTIVTNRDSSDWQIVFWLNAKGNNEFDSIHEETLYQSNTKETQSFSIQSTANGKLHTILITSLSTKGLANGLYYFLQNKLGFQFYHPKETYVPDLSQVVLDTFTETISPRFDKIGFHIHAMHPLEITEALLNENTPNGAEEIKTYIDWLCRNGQNYFEFNLLSSIRLKTWIPYIQPVVDYAHERGIICGADMSFHMIQQRAFQLYKKFPSSFKKKEVQILNNIRQLMQIHWDVWNVEFATTEFTHKNQQQLHEQQQFLYQQLKPYHVTLTSRKHVVQDKNLISNTKSLKTGRTDMDSAYSLFVHTVMFYSLQDSTAPVYRNKDFSFQKELLKESKTYRDTWYFPESAYWITFDNSVPMFLTPYLKARLNDILYCDSLGINGHLTFSSGWEWNYWAIDWSIARWCWREAGQQLQPLEYLQQAVRNDTISQLLSKTDALQELYIKGKQLIKVMDAQTITDEIGGKLNLEFHPRPEYPYKYIINKANKDELMFIQQKYIEQLDTFVQQFEQLKKQYPISSKNKLSNELWRSLEITTLRAAHRKNTLSYLVASRLKKLNKSKESVAVYLDKAAEIRAKALVLVKQQEAQYRYPVQSLAGTRKSKTVYDFGYLYPVSNLHFWEREELQAKHNKWKFWYQNLWDVLKIIGVKK